MLTSALARSGSRLEDIHWENLLGTLLTKLLLGRKSGAIESALDFLANSDTDAYEILIEQAETFSESAELTIKGVTYDALLFSAPLVAWTRYQLPKGALTAQQCAALQAALGHTIMAPKARLAVLPQLVSFDHMPQTFQDTRHWTQVLAGQALGQAPSQPLSVPAEPQENESILADARFLVGAVVVPKGEPLFRWQLQASETQFISRDECNQQWQEQAGQVLGPLFAGCQIDYLPVDAYYVNNREADRRIRPLALKAAITWLHTAANLPADQLRASIAGCGEMGIEEYRIGLSTRQSNDVIYGCIWPVLSKEEALAETLDTGIISASEEIAALLKEAGVSEIRRLPGVLPLDQCDDCGAPFFPNPVGEMVHPELPEEADFGPIHFH